MGDEGTRFYRESDADPCVLEASTLAVIGYGNLGRAIALNLRDGGHDVIVGNRLDEHRTAAADDDMDVLDIPEAASAADLIYMLIPDEEIPAVFSEHVAPHLRPGSAICFASGYVLAYRLVDPSPDVDVLMLAPRMLGEEVRRTYLDGTGFFSYVSVEQDASGRAEARLLALAAAAGSLTRGAMPLPAEQEALLDLMIEQTVGPYLGTAIQLAFHLGVEAGLPPEAMVLEMYMSGEMSRTFQTFADVGFFESVDWHGVVAQYGGFLRTLDLDREAMDRLFRAVIEDIRSGGFARKLQEEREAGFPTLDAIRSVITAGSPITEAERRVRDALND